MNTLKSCLAYTVLVSFLFFSSCNIEPYDGEIPDQAVDSNGNPIENPTDNNSELGVFQVDFDGETYEADNVIGTLAGGVMNITAFKGSDQESFVLTLFADKTGTYEVGVTSNTIEVNSVTYSENTLTGEGDVWIGVTDFMTSQGEVVITEIDEENKTISGTFFFTGHNVEKGAKEFTNGTFNNVSYGTDILPSNSANSFFAKVDGVEFIEDAVQGMAVSLGGINNIGISATKNNLETIGLNLDANVVPGEYELSTFSIPSGLYSKSFSESYASNAGKVIITTHDVANKHIVGTFEFTATSFLSADEKYEVTEGSFDITYL
ncbi:MAG: DUF6252 family protein [Algibacter sp.]